MPMIPQLWDPVILYLCFFNGGKPTRVHLLMLTWTHFVDRKNNHVDHSTSFSRLITRTPTLLTGMERPKQINISDVGTKRRDGN